MAAKQQSPSSSEQSTDLGKICFICYCLPRDPQLDDFSFGDDDPSRSRTNNYCLFLLDLDAEESSDYVPVNPTLCFDSVRLANFNLNPNRRPRMDYLGVYGHCVLCSKLYLFGRGKRDVFSYELPCAAASIPSLSSPLELTDDALTAAPFMNSPKYYPVACQTPDGRKMIVFSTELDAEDEKIVDFELFDPVEGSWTPLADLRPLLRSVGLLDRYVSVLSYSFIDNGPILLVITIAGDFALDTEEDNAVWSKFGGLEFPLSDCHGHCMLVKDRLRLTDCFAWLDGTDPWEWPSRPGELNCYPSPGSGITWLSSDRFCVVRNYIEASTLKPHLIIDVCEFDSLDDTDEVPAMKVKKTFKFVVGHQIEPTFYTESLFPIRLLEEGV